MSSQAQTVKPFLGRYQLEKKLAVGGMAEIYLAQVTGAGGFQKQVVVKRILPHLAETEERFHMLLDEARIAATLQHPNVVQVFDACEEGGEYFIAMEYLDGTDLFALSAVLAEGDVPLPWEHALHIVLSVASGLHYAHEKQALDGTPLGIVHRDVSPHNVFLTREGGVKLVDFGIAKAQGRTTETTFGTLKGKLAYMSPEQCIGESVDRRSDIYSLGIILYELTTGQRFYRDSTEYRLIKEIVEGEIRLPSSFMDFPGDLEDIILRCLDKDPQRRYQSAREIQLALEDFARKNHLLFSDLGLSTFLEPLLEQAKETAANQWKHRREVLPILLNAKDPTPAPDVAPRTEGAVSATVVRREVMENRAQARLPVGERGTLPASPVRVCEPMYTELSQRDMRVTRRSGGLWLGALVLSGAVGAGLWYGGPLISGSIQAATEITPVLDVARAEIGTLDVGGDAGGEVWLFLGKTPIDTVAVNAESIHRIRVEHEGYRSIEMALGPAHWQQDPGGIRFAVADIELRPLGQPLAETGAPPENAPALDSTTPRPANLRLSTSPEGASAWLFVGTTPSVQIGNLDTSKDVQLRIKHGDEPPVFLAVSSADFDDRGLAHVAVELPERAPTTPETIPASVTASVAEAAKEPAGRRSASRKSRRAKRARRARARRAAEATRFAAPIPQTREAPVEPAKEPRNESAGSGEPTPDWVL